eukprot:2918661-Amphidinium_carterae.1
MNSSCVVAFARSTRFRGAINRCAASSKCIQMVLKRPLVGAYKTSLPVFRAYNSEATVQRHELAATGFVEAACALC